jgi:hypothetical protein
MGLLNASVGTQSDTYISYGEMIGNCRFWKNSPSASATGPWESNARNRLDEGRFPCALPANDRDGRDAQFDVGSTTQVCD